MLNNALEQTGWDDGNFPDGNWRVDVLQHRALVDWLQASADVRPFLEPGSDSGLLNLENLTGLLS